MLTEAKTIESLKAAPLEIRRGILKGVVDIGNRTEQRLLKFSDVALPEEADEFLRYGEKDEPPIYAELRKRIKRRPPKAHDESGAAGGGLANSTPTFRAAASACKRALGGLRSAMGL